MSDNHDLHDKQISRLYKLGSKTEPPHHIDAEITHAAHAAIPGQRRRFIRPSLATAAVLVLSISLVFKVLDQEPLEKSVMDSLPTDQSDSIAQPAESELDTHVLVKTKEKVTAPAAVMPDADTTRAGKPLPQPQRSAPKKYQTTRPEQKPKPPAAFKQDDSLGKTQTQMLSAPIKEEGTKLQKKSRMQLGYGKRLLRQKRKSMAPAVTASSILERFDCKTIQLPDSNSAAEWHHHYKTAMEQGQEQYANCLKQTYLERFGKALPEHLNE
ncbi:MAG: hypothetical protein GY814_09000 [Gammaproteobacteria bacterium]|nr:hypothetical protein [Gammaproteobacteria bacterium]